MRDILNVANYICEYYKQIANEPIDELKLQKLLYFCQREKLSIVNEPLFKEPLEGWVHGPVSPLVRSYFEDGDIVCMTEKLSEQDAYIVRGVLQQYAGCASWKLRDLTHMELSWQRSREGLAADQRGNRKLELDDIRIDSQKVRPFDDVWGMFYDEFEDIEVN